MLRLRQALLISLKDVTQRRRDLWASGFAFGFPIAFATAFFFFLTPALSAVSEDSGEPFAVHLATREEAETSLSGQIIDQLVSAGAFEGVQFVRIAYEDAERDVEDGSIDGFIFFPASFTADVFLGRGAELVVFSGGNAQAQAHLASIANSMAGTFRTQAVVVTALTGLSGDAVLGAAQMSPASGGRSQDGELVEFTVTEVGDIEPPNAADFTVPGYLVMFVFMAAAFTAQAIAEEREAGTLERLATSGAGPLAIISGKFLSSFYLGVVQVVILGAFGALVFGMKLGESPMATVAVALLMSLASSAFGVMLASLVRTVRATASAAVLVSLVAAPLGGSWWPLFILDDWMRSLALVTPHGWANTALNRLMLFGGDFGSVAYEMLALAGFALGFIAIAVWRFRASPL